MSQKVPLCLLALTVNKHNTLVWKERFGKLLNKLELCRKQTDLERLDNMQLMKPLEWTPELREQHRKINRVFWPKTVKVLGTICDVAVTPGLILQFDLSDLI